MIQNILIYFLLAVIAFFPIVIWAYIFSYIDDNPLNKKRFVVGIIGGALSVVPILYMDTLLDFGGLRYMNIFAYIAEVSTLFSSVRLWFSLSLFLLFLVGFSFLFGVFIHKFRSIVFVYVKNSIVFLVFIFFISVFVYVFHLLFGRFDFVLGESIEFGDVLFNSFKLLVFYYLLVSFIEESSKHFNFLQSSVLYIRSVKEGVLYSIFVALGFGFIENVLYLHTYYVQYGATGHLLQIYFFRSVFSIIVHLLCSSVVGYYFSQALVLYREKDLSFPYLRIFLYGLTFSIFLHLFFDIALTLGFSFVVFFYFIGGYLYVSSIFYRDEK